LAGLGVASLKMKLPTWKALRLASLLSALFCAQASTTQIVPNDSEPRISVRISTTRTRFKPGKDVPLHVEIWNEGKQDVFISKSIDADVSNALATMDLTLYYGPHADRPMFSLAADSFSSERSTYPPLASELPKYWIAVAPHHFYGGEVVVRGSWFKKLKVPGKYRIQGKYTSRGFLAQDINNPLLHYAGELNRLPYKAWVGEVETNSIWIEITEGVKTGENSPNR
jgi:hypothetical protein